MSRLLGVIFSVQMSTNFLTWLDELMNRNGFSNAEFARRGGISESIVSKVRNQERGVGFDFCQAVSRVFTIPLAVVYRRAGLLPELPEDEEEKEELDYLFNTLSVEGKNDLLIYARFLLAEEKKHA